MKIIENLDLTEYNSYKIKASCKRGFFPCNESDIIKFFNDRNYPYKIIGSGNNIIFSKEYYEEDFIILGSSFDQLERIDKLKIRAQTGSTLEELSLFALEHNLTGLEHFYDIPSSIGGAIVMNAGARNVEIKNVLEEVSYYSVKENKIISKTLNELNFSYRMSPFQNNRDNVILNATFLLREGSKSSIKEKMNSLRDKRWGTQPRSYPNAGSVFKRPEGYFVGQIIEELGLKGYQIGGAQISEKHGGFIVNKGEATGQDILNLISYIQKEVKERKGISLEVEQRII
jgi:UDP-N-acetylmuramate dehydrogenase